MDRVVLVLYTDYLISSVGQVTATGLSARGRQQSTASVPTASIPTASIPTASAASLRQTHSPPPTCDAGASPWFGRCRARRRSFCSGRGSTPACATTCLFVMCAVTPGSPRPRTWSSSNKRANKHSSETSSCHSGPTAKQLQSSPERRRQQARPLCDPLVS